MADDPTRLSDAVRYTADDYESAADVPTRFTRQERAAMLRQAASSLRERGAGTCDELVEKLADWDHSAWAGWTRHMLDNLTPENIARWRRQIDTPYANLSDREQELDRKEAREILAVIQAFERRPEGGSG